VLVMPCRAHNAMTQRMSLPTLRFAIGVSLYHGAWVSVYHVAIRWAPCHAFHALPSAHGLQLYALHFVSLYTLPTRQVQSNTPICARRCCSMACTSRQMRVSMSFAVLYAPHRAAHLSETVVRWEEEERLAHLTPGRVDRSSSFLTSLLGYPVF
jgi:hypothetical protein